MINANGPRLHEYIKALYSEGFNANGDGEEIVTIGECWAADTETALKYNNSLFYTALTEEIYFYKMFL